MRHYQQIIEDLSERNPGALLADGLDPAIIGIARRCGSPEVAIYSVDKIITILAKDSSLEDAYEHFEFNIVGGYVGENGPIFLE